MKVTILGSGNVAEAIAAAVGSGLPGISPGEIWARSGSGAETAARHGFRVAESPETLAPADLYIVSISDDAIGEVSARMKVDPDAVVAHTAGGVSVEAIAAETANRAVFYPLQTFSKGRGVDFRSVPVFIEHSTPRAEKVVGEFAGAISGSVNHADSRLRLKLHTAAVFVCNFTNALYTLGARLVEEEGLSFDVLKPLIEETAAKAVAASDPARVQTGPAIRGDIETQRRHLELLRGEGKEEYAEIYKMLTETIWETLKKI